MEELEEFAAKMKEARENIKFFKGKIKDKEGKN